MRCIHLTFEIYLLTTRPPPTSTLFPYTTLFRSSRAGKDLRRHGRGGRSAARGMREPARRAQLGEVSFGRSGPRLDRKSTRLNSSHSQSSYAVFCLKKKILATKDRREKDYSVAMR